MRVRQDQPARADYHPGTVVPMFYERENGLPGRWVRRVKRAIMTLAWRFNGERMVIDYATGSYAPAAGIDSSSRPARTRTC